MKFCEQFLRFFVKRPLLANFSKSCSEVYMATPIDVVVLKCRKICIRREIGEIVRYLPNREKNSAASQTVAIQR